MLMRADVNIEALIARLDQLRRLTYPGNRIFVLCVEVADALREQRAENKRLTELNREICDVSVEPSNAEELAHANVGVERHWKPTSDTYSDATWTLE